MPTVPEAIPQPDAILRYGNGAVFLHWLTAALVVAQVIVGFTFSWLPRGPAQAEWFTWHKTLGATILLLALVRLAWRLGHKPPPFPDTLSRFERVAATWTHRVFYALLILLPLTGLLTISGGADRATTGLVGGLRLPLVPGVSDDAARRRRRRTSSWSSLRSLSSSCTSPARSNTSSSTPAAPPGACRPSARATARLQRQ